MRDKDTLIKGVQKKLEGSVRLPHQACVIGYDLFLLAHLLKLRSDPQVKDLISTFIHSLPTWSLNDILNRQVNYAIRIAESEDNLEYEEMHKLLSLCDEIYALEYIGLNFDKNLKNRYEESIRKRFSIEQKKARMASEDKVEDWQREFWWYKENIT